MQQFYYGVRKACEEYGFHIAGGDLSSSELIVISVAMLGSCYAEPIRRSTARSGDAIFVTGPVGGSAAGLELLLANPDSEGPLADIHKAPKARLREAEAISRLGASSAIDISDGLIADLNHICENSHLGAALTDIPVTPGASMDNAKYGGEDYELIFSHQDQAIVHSTFTSLGLRVPYMIGSFTDAAGITLLGEDVVIGGYRHDF